MGNFCTECGSALQAEWKVCPNCGVPIISLPEQGSAYKVKTLQRPVQYQYPKSLVTLKTSKQKWAEKSWIFSLVAGIIGLVSLLTPFSSGKIYNFYGVLVFSFEQWWFGYNTVYDYDLGYESFWMENLSFLLPEVITLIIVIFSNLLILIIAARLPKRAKNTSNWLIGGAIGLLGSSIALIAIFELLFMIDSDYSYWQMMSPGFAIIWQFIGFVLVIIGYSVGKLKYPVQQQPQYDLGVKS